MLLHMNYAVGSNEGIYREGKDVLNAKATQKPKSITRIFYLGMLDGSAFRSSPP